MTARPRLTSVEREVLDRLRQMSQHADPEHEGWVKAGFLTAGAALRGLVSKGRAEQKDTPVGNSGATTWWVRPLAD